MAAKKKAVGKKKAKGGSSPRRRAAKPTKAETVEVTVGGESGSAPLLAGNMPPVKDLMYHLGQIKGYQDAAKTASGRVTAAKKAAKEAGVDMTAIAIHLGFRRADALDLATILKQLTVLMREDGLPVQLSLYEPKFGSIEEQSKHEGWNDGIAGKTPNTARWPEGSPGSVDYMRRWNDAQKEIIMKGVAADEEENGED